MVVTKICIPTLPQYSRMNETYTNNYKIEDTEGRTYRR